MDVIKKNRKSIFDVFFVLLVFVISFPNFEPDFNTGLDSPFRWGFNYLWIHDYKTLTELIYSYGPLAFLKVPVALGNNFLFFLIFYSISKISLLLGLIYSNNALNKFLIYPIILIMAYFLSVDIIIIGLVLLGTIFYLNKENLWFYILSFFVSLLGLYIKSSIGISCLGIILTLWITLLLKRYSAKRFFILFVISIAIILITNLIIGKDFNYLFKYLYNVLTLSSGYSSSMALFPENNWLLLTLSLVSIAIVPLILDRPDKGIFLLFLIPLYSFWKHAMVRESIVYYFQSVEFVIFFWGIMLLTSSSNKNKLFFLLPLLSISLFFSNAFSIDSDFKYKKNINGYVNFNSSTLNFQRKMTSMTTVSLKNVEKNKLKNDLRELIGTKTIDIYPWDLSYIPANNFNWQPRSTFQSIGLSSWSDKMTQNSFSKSNGPEFIIFQTKKDAFGGELGSIDYRYLLNVEPLTNIQLFKNYNIIQNNKSWLSSKIDMC